MNKKIEFDFGGKKKLAKAKERKKNVTKGLALGAAAGSALGALSGILFAPKAGKETRQQIKDEVTEAAKKAAVEVKDAGEKAATGIKELASKANELVNEKLRSRKDDCCCDEAAPCNEDQGSEVTPEDEI